MKVQVDEAQRQHQAIFEDEATTTVAGIVNGHRRLLRLVISAVRDYKTAEALNSRNPNLRKVARTYARTRSDRRIVDKLCSCLEKLYRTYDPSHVRGILIEAMLQDAIKSEYGGSRDLLDNNVKFSVTNGLSYTSRTSIDVIGFSMAAEAGECHDCKVASKTFDSKWIEELVKQVAPSGFRIGLATADSEARAEKSLRDKGISLTQNAILVTGDQWWSVLPLQKFS